MNQEFVENFNPTIESSDLVVDDDTPFETNQKQLKQLNLNLDDGDDDCTPVKSMRDLLKCTSPEEPLFQPIPLTTQELIQQKDEFEQEVLDNM